MGNYRFSPIDMIPNAWFHKLNNTSSGNRNHSIPHPTNRRTHPQRTPPTSSSSSSSPKTPQNPLLSSSKNQSFFQNRASYYFPRSETEKPPNSPINLKTSDTHFPINPPRKSERRSRRNYTKPSAKIVTSSVSTSCGCRALRSEFPMQKPIITDRFLELELSPIRTKPEKNGAETVYKLFEATEKKSFAVVKPSSDPQRDFRDSMIEMIVENKIRASKDLEDLLACYLTLNSNEYHGVIVKVFEQIWFDLTENY